MQTRPATKEDRDDILDLLELMDGEIGQFELSKKKVRATVDELFKNGRIAVLVNQEREIVGCIGLYAWEAWYSEQAMLSDVFVYILPDYRTWPGFRMLMKAAEATSNETGLPFILNLYALKDTERKEFLFQKFADQLVRGYQYMPVGGLFKKEG